MSITENSLTTEARPLLEVPDADLDDLRARLGATRWATPWPLPAWQAGTDGEELRRLVAYWASDYDWRKHEAAINALPSHFADIDGTVLHYLRFDGEQADALPIVLTNGWPSSFFELIELRAGFPPRPSTAAARQTPSPSSCRPCPGSPSATSARAWTDR